MKKVLVIIPCYNEAENLSKVVDKVREASKEYDILIVNDCSTDKSLKVALSLNVNVIDLPCNLGIGGAVQTGYIYGVANNYDYMVQLDGDGQHNPEEIARMLEKCDYGYDMVIGSRFIEKKGFQSNAVRRLGINWLSLVIKILTGQTISDSTSGLRMVNRRVAKEFILYYPFDYPEPETNSLIIKKGYKVTEIPVVMNERDFGVSSINLKKSIYYMVKVTIAIILVLFSKRSKEVE